MGDSGLETSVLFICTSQLEKAFQSDRDLAHYLNKEGYLADDHYNEITDPWSKLSRREKSSVLVSGIRNTVALNPQRYHELLKHLRLYPRKYRDIIGILDKEYGKGVSRRLSSAILTGTGVVHSSKRNNSWSNLGSICLSLLQLCITIPMLLLIFYTLWKRYDHISFHLIPKAFSNHEFGKQSQGYSNEIDSTLSTSNKKSFDSSDFDDLDLSGVNPVLLSSGLNKYNITIHENHGLNERTSYWWLCFTFDYELEKAIEVRLTNYKYHPDQRDWTLEVTKCVYLGIQNKDQMASFDMADKFINAVELSKLVASSENLWQYLEHYIVPLVTKKIKYTKYKPQFRFYLSHLSKDMPFMRTFENGLRFLGYVTWLKESVKPFGNILANMKTAIDECDCFLAWIDETYMKDMNCRRELLYARNRGKIILPFGDSQTLQQYFVEDFQFMKVLHIYNPMNDSFFEVLQHIDATIFNFETIVL